MFPPWLKGAELEAHEKTKDGSPDRLCLSWSGCVSKRYLEMRGSGQAGERLWAGGGTPFREVRVQLSLKPEGEGCRIAETVRFKLPSPFFCEGLWGKRLREPFQALLCWRAETLGDLLEVAPGEPSDEAGFRVLMTGGTGFLGSALRDFLEAIGCEVVVLSRSGKGPGVRFWDPGEGRADLESSERFDAVIHLAGASVAQRWTPRVRERIHRSRVDSTRFLAGVVAKMEKPPSTFLSGSAIGFYGYKERGMVDEVAGPGGGFLSQVCQDWEAAALNLEDKVGRLVFLRTGVVLDPRGGALASMLPVFRMGAGGKLGSGNQAFPWISLRDWVRAVASILFDEGTAGPVNLVAPVRDDNARFARTLAKTLRRPCLLPAPAVALKTLLGGMAEEMLLGGVAAEPRKLLDRGFAFRDVPLEKMLSQVLAR